MGASMLADDIADRITIASPAELDDIIRGMWVDHTHGLLTDNEMEILDEAARTRREAIQARCQAARPVGPARRPGNAPRASARPRGARPQRSPDRQASIERRRRLVASGPLPPPLAARFTWGEIAVMRIVGDECRVHGCCTLHIDAIAARAGVHRTTVQNALREAQAGSLAGPPSSRCRSAVAAASGASPTSSASSLAIGGIGSTRAHPGPP
jgi:hypothetical protein